MFIKGNNHTGFKIQVQSFGLHSFIDMNIKDGQRASTSTDYLRPVLHRSNLHINSRVLVEKVLIEGNKAIGVQYQKKGHHNNQVPYLISLNNRSKRIFSQKQSVIHSTWA